MVNLRKKLAAPVGKQVVARKESSKGKANLVKLQEELLVKLYHSGIFEKIAKNL